MTRAHGDHRSLDELCLDKILEYVKEAPARGTCKKWADHIFSSCNLEGKIRLNKLLQENGSLEFDCFATRELGADIMVTAAFHFEFLVDGKFDLQWYHGYSGDMDFGSQQLSGTWRAQGNTLLCEYVTEPKEGLMRRVVTCPAKLETCVSMDELNSTPPKGSSQLVTFHVPQHLVFAGRVMYEDDDSDSSAFPWKLSDILLSNGREASAEAMELKPFADLQLPEKTPDEAPDAQYVHVDGRRVVVCTDIVEKYPPESWANLMKFRLQFDTA